LFAARGGAQPAQPVLALPAQGGCLNNRRVGGYAQNKSLAATGRFRRL